MTLPVLLRQTARARPDKSALVLGDRTVTYGELDRRVDGVAAWLRDRLDVERGQRVLVIGPSHPDLVVAIYGLWRAGAVVVPVNPMSTASDVDYVAADSGARLALVDELLQVGLGSCAPALRRISLAEAVAASLTTDIDDVDDRSAAPDELCVLPYTSGTTGRPKGCVHTPSTLLASLRSSARWRSFDEDTVFLGNTPLFHMQGFQNGMNLPLMLGATSVMQPRWDPVEAAGLIERHRVTAWSAAPTMLVDFFSSEQALRRDLTSLRLVSGGGAALPEPIAAALKDRLGLRYNEAYGLTETASFLQANPVGGGKVSCLGLAPEGVDSRVVDPETGEPVADGELGELVTHAPQLLVRYWDEGEQPHANESAFLQIDGKRFLRTGDLVTRDAEGYFFLRDRLKRMINSAGFKVWPAEVERLLQQHPDIREACVFAMRDARRGEAVKAIVVLRPGATLTANELIAWSRAAMAIYKAPHAVEFRDALPRSATGKTAWRELQDQQRRLDATGD